MNGNVPSAPAAPATNIYSFSRKLKNTVVVRYRKLLDDVTPYVPLRWGFTALTLLLYAVRVWYLGGWYIITYALGIYVLNLLIGFLSPQADPLDEDPSGEGPNLPRSNDDEFKPFIRRLPEFKFWEQITRAIWIAIVCTFFTALNVPVFWPILLLYFCVLFFVTMKKQIMHMVKYKYIPFTRGKPKFSGRKVAS